MHNCRPSESEPDQEPAEQIEFILSCESGRVAIKRGLTNSRPCAVLFRYAEVRLVGQTHERGAQGTENQSPVISQNTISRVCVTEIETSAQISFYSRQIRPMQKSKEHS